jgi:hypothetical protein
VREPCMNHTNSWRYNPVKKIHQQKSYHYWNAQFYLEESGKRLWIFFICCHSPVNPFQHFLQFQPARELYHQLSI